MAQKIEWSANTWRECAESMTPPDVERFEKEPAGSWGGFPLGSFARWALAHAVQGAEEAGRSKIGKRAADGK